MAEGIYRGIAHPADDAGKMFHEEHAPQQRLSPVRKLLKLSMRRSAKAWRTRKRMLAHRGGTA